jgi:hypothetical protein
MRFCVLTSSGRFVAAILAGTAGLPHATALLAQETPSTTLAVAGLQARVVHRFDFDEAPAGNMEEVPMFWSAMPMVDFPAFAEGRFDRNVGRTAPPSFHLASAGRNVAYVYEGPDTRVRPGASYRIEGFIRPDRLVHARACLGVHYTDREGRALLKTMVRSSYVAQAESAEPWQRVELILPPAPPEAHTIGLTTWVLQERVWDTSPSFRRPIDHADVRGGAWFDDIIVARMPVVGLTSSSPGNALPPGSPHELRILLNDPDVQELTGELEIRDAAGAVVQRATVMQDPTGSGGLHRVKVTALPPGLFEATLVVSAENGGTDRRQLTFAVLPPRLHGDDFAPKAFGVVIADPLRGDGRTELDLVANQGVRSLKYPVWAAGEQGGDATDLNGLEMFLGELNRRGVTPSAVLGGPPGSVVSAGHWLENPLLEVLGSSSTEWTEELARVAAPYAGAFRWWQLGADAAMLPDPGKRFSTAAGNLRAALGRFITGPQLAGVGVSLDDPSRERLPVEHMTVTLGRDVDTDWMEEWFKGYSKVGYEQVSLFVPPLAEEAYERLSRLADWTQRVISARHAGASVVYVPQTWRTRDSSSGALSEPTEEFIALRTIADVLGDSRPGPRLFVAEGVRAPTFESGGDAVMSLWDPAAPREGRVHPIQLGRATRMIDLWGTVTPIERNADGVHLVRLSPLPIFVDGVDRWLVELGHSVAIEPTCVTSGTEMVKHTLRIGGGAAFSGQGSIQAPPSMEISPRDFAVRASGEPTQVEFTVHYPHSEPAGRKKFLVRLTVGPDRRVLEIPVFVELGLDDVEVAGSSFLEGEDLVLQHVISNRSAKTLSFRGSAAVPGRERQYRPISNLAPGETQTVEYRFLHAADLMGRHVRLMLRELNDGPRTHTLELAVQ